MRNSCCAAPEASTPASPDPRARPAAGGVRRRVLAGRAVRRPMRCRLRAVAAADGDHRAVGEQHGVQVRCGRPSSGGAGCPVVRDRARRTRSRTRRRRVGAGESAPACPSRRAGAPRASRPVLSGTSTAEPQTREKLKFGMSVQLNVGRVARRVRTTRCRSYTARRRARGRSASRTGAGSSRRRGGMPGSSSRPAGPSSPIVPTPSRAADGVKSSRSLFLTLWSIAGLVEAAHDERAPVWHQQLARVPAAVVHVGLLRPPSR